MTLAEHVPSGSPLTDYPLVVGMDLIVECGGDLEQAALLQRLHDWGATEGWVSAESPEFYRMTRMSPDRVEGAIERAHEAGRLLVRTRGEGRQFLVVTE